MEIGRAVDGASSAIPPVTVPTSTSSVHAGAVTISVITTVAYVCCIVPLTVGDWRSCSHCDWIEGAPVLIDLSLIANRNR